MSSEDVAGYSSTYPNHTHDERQRLNNSQQLKLLTFLLLLGMQRTRGSVISGNEMQGSVIDLLWPITGVHRI